MKSHSKPALIHTVAVISGGGWNTVKQQIERADTVEKIAAKENEFSEFSEAPSSLHSSLMWAALWHVQRSIYCTSWKTFHA